MPPTRLSPFCPLFFLEGVSLQNRATNKRHCSSVSLSAYGNPVGIWELQNEECPVSPCKSGGGGCGIHRTLQVAGKSTIDSDLGLLPGIPQTFCPWGLPAGISLESPGGSGALRGDGHPDRWGGLLAGPGSLVPRIEIFIGAHRGPATLTWVARRFPFLKAMDP